MNREELNAILNEMDEEERRLTLNADDAMDALYAYRIHKEYGVDVICNPNGDRTKVSIDGVIMNAVEFAAWLNAKIAENNSTGATEEELPETVIIDIDDLDLDGSLDSEKLEKAVKKWLRNNYEHYLAKGAELDIDIDDDEISVYNISWGRKLSRAELNN